MFSRDSIRRFWEYVSSRGRYKDEERTNEFPEEIPWLVDLLEATPEVDCVLSWGSADGAREPGGILAALCPRSRVFSVYCVECTDGFFADIHANLEPFQYCIGEFKTFLSPSQELDEWLELKKGAFAIAHIGVYDLGQFFQTRIGLRDYLENLRSPTSSPSKYFYGSFEFYFLITGGDGGIDRVEDVPGIVVTEYEVRSVYESALARVEQEIQVRVTELKNRYGDSFLGILCLCYDEGRDVAFQSAWYAVDGLAKLVNGVFDGRGRNIEWRYGTKGMAASVRNEGLKGSGAVICANNVLGCTFWQDQDVTLRTFAELMSPRPRGGISLFREYCERLWLRFKR